MHRIAVGVTWVLIFTPVARAHLGSSKFLRVDPRPDGAAIVAELDAIDVAVALGLSPDHPDPVALIASRDAIEAWLARDLRVSSDGQPCVLHLTSARATERDQRPYLAVDLRYVCPLGEVRVLTDDAVFGDDPRHQSFVRMGDHEREIAEVLSRGRRSITISGPPPELLDVSLVFLVEGMVHLATGFDHLLFLLSLMLVAGQRARSDGFRVALRQVALVVTGFTIGHSVTLIAAALDFVRLPSRWVEVAIALSIVLVALANLVRTSPARSHALPAIAIAFGLIHGFGFASVLSELALSSEARVVPLLAFNVGIEIAQLGFVLVLLFPLAWLAKRAWYRDVVVRGGSGVIILIASYWVVERLLAVG